MTGCGTAVDAASRGLSVALVEAGDFAEGTSSRSSKMVHGGLRYLQQREFRLVYENLHERQRLLENAPHLVRPLPFLIPLFGKDGVVAKAVARSYRTALWLYDVTGGWRIGRRHQRLTRAEVVDDFPSLDVERLVAGFMYWDAKGDDAVRIVMRDPGDVPSAADAMRAMATAVGAQAEFEVAIADGDALLLTLNPAALKARAEEVFAARERGEPTVPTTIAREKATNPFLRAGDAARFAAVRAAKDAFKG